MERKVLKLFGGKIWPWLAVWGVLAVAAIVTTKTLPERHPGYMYYMIALVALLFTGLAGYAAIRSLKSKEESFVDVFQGVFHRHWVYFILFVFAVSVFAIVWTTVVTNVSDFTGWCSFKSEILEYSVVAPFKEEVQFRLLPFMVAVIPLAVVTSRRWRMVLFWLSVVMIFCVQMQFGFMHLDPLNVSGNDRVSIHLWIQGVVGVLYAFTFGMVLYYAYLSIRARQAVANKHRAVLLSIPIAYMASCCVHAMYNLYFWISCLF